MAALRLRLRTPAGQKTCQVPSGATVAEFRALVASTAGVEPTGLVLRAGFPPQQIDISTIDDSTVAATALPIASGDTLTVEGAANGPSSASGPSSSSSLPSGPSPSTSNGLSRLVEREVPDDNSCMFRSVAAIVFNDPSMNPSSLREICARKIASDPITYSETMLQRPNSDYCRWIQTANAWGGPIELSILSQHFNVRIDAYDIDSTLAQCYGEQSGFSMTGYLIFNGLHYNYMARPQRDGTDTVQFSTTDESTRAEAQALVCKRKEMGMYTNTRTFKIKCLECGEILVGEAAAVEHSRLTGHTKFEQV